MITLFPRNGFWRSIFGRPFKYLVESCEAVFDDFREEAFAVLMDVFPGYTRQTELWTDELGGQDPTLAWGYRGGMSLAALNEALHVGGFPQLFFYEYVSDAEENAGNGAACTPRNLGAFDGYILANYVPVASPAWECLCGENEAYCGEEGAYCGEYSSMFRRVIYTPIADYTMQSHEIAVATEDFSAVEIDAEERQKLEELVMRIRPLRCRVIFWRITYA